MKHPSISSETPAAFLRAAAIGSLTVIGAAAAEMSFPAAPDSGVLTVEWEGESQIRAGQNHEYTLNIRNETDNPVRDVVVYQKLPSSFQLQKSEPPTARNQRMQGRQGEDFQQGMQRQNQERQQRRDQAVQAIRERMQAADQDSEQKQQPSDRENQQQSDQANRQQQQSDREQQQSDRQQQARQGQRGQDSAQTMSWRIGSLDPGATQRITVTGRASSEGSMESCIWVDFKPTFCQTIEVVKPDLALEQTILDGAENERDIFYACENVVLRYELTNTGSGEVSNAKIEIDMPEGFSATDNQKSTIEVGTLDAGETSTHEVRLEAGDTGEFPVSATASSGDLQADSGQGTIEIVRPELQLTVNGPDNAYLGRSVSYDITVKNTSDVPALGTEVELPLSVEGMRFASTGDRIDGEGERFTLGDLDGGESKTFSITFDPSEPGEIESTAIATAYCAKDQEKKVTTTVEGIPALQISVIDRDDPVKVGNETVYELQVRNEGSMEDVNIRLTAELSDTMEFISAEGDTEISGEGGNLEFDPIDKLAPGDVVSWNIRVQGTKEGRGSLKVNLESDSTKDVRSSEPTTVY